ncbi:hypothetical protein ACXVUM_11835 [Williamsia sp. SKLECPSW1]
MGDDGETPRREIIAESWRRCRAIGLDRDALPRSCPVEQAFYDYRDAHPMNEIRLLLERTIGDDTIGSDSFVFLTDERAGGLWVSDREGYETHTAAPTLLILLSEESAGTTASALALLHDTEVQVHGPEHYLRALGKWWTAAAPVRDRVTGRVIGTVGVSTVGDDVSRQPISMLALRSIVQLVDNRDAVRDPAATRRRGPATLVLCGPRAPRVVLDDGTDHPLTRRQCEILLLLHRHTAGLRADQLALALSEDGLDPVTVRAEVSRLRAVIGGGVVESRPYRLDPSLRCDLVDAAAAAAAGDPWVAVRALDGGCAVSDSTGPGVTEVVDEIVSDLRSGVMASSDARVFDAWTATGWGRHDDAAWRRLAALTGDDGAALRARGRAEIIDRRFGLR